MDPLHAEAIRQAADLARAGDRDGARQKLEEVLEEDETNVPAWLLLARITENPDEKRMALTTVLQLDPDNARAKELLDKLDAKLKAAGPKDEVLPGISRQTFLRIAAAVGAFVVLTLVGAVVIVSGNNRRQAERDRAATQAVLALTQLKLTETQIAANSTQAAIDLTQTLFARVSPTPTATPTRNLPTLPPTPTLSPTPTDTATLAPITGIPGRIIAWGGRDLSGTGTLPILVYTLGGSRTPETLPLNNGIAPAFSPDATMILYTVFNRTRSSLDVTLVDLEGQRMPSTLDQAPSLGGYDESQMGSFSRNGSRITFIGSSLASLKEEVYVVVLSGEMVNNQSVIQLTNNSGDYSYPSLSPDGSRVVAVRTVTEGDNPGTDLVIIDVASRTFTPLTTDQNTTIETMARWSPDGTIIAYAASAPTNPRSRDLYLIAPNNPGSGFKVIEDPADDIYPIFNPDGRYLAFASNRNGTYNIYLYNLTAQQLFQLTDGRDPVYPGGWVVP